MGVAGLTQVGKATLKGEVAIQTIAQIEAEAFIRVEIVTKVNAAQSPFKLVGIQVRDAETDLAIPGILTTSIARGE